MLEKTYQEEQNEFFERFIFNDLFGTFKNNKKPTKIELYITPECNKQCEYCYLWKNKNDLYPKEIRDENTILKNLEIYLKFLIKKDVRVDQIQLFSGEIWGTEFGYKIFDVLLNNGIEKITRSIIIPSNCSFVNNDKHLEKIKDYIIKFLLKNVRIAYSASYDGLILDDENRPFVDSKKKIRSDFTDKLFDFVDVQHTGFHPMIAAAGIEKQVENFDWWAQECEKRGWNPIDRVMTLEVRNADWTPEKIKSYLIWLDHITKYAYETLGNNNDDEMLDILTGYSQKMPKNYIPFTIRFGGNKISCNLVHHHTVRLGDLAIVPCHRLSYEKLIYGKYIIENDEIVGIEAMNTNFALQNFLLNNFGYLKCDTCEIREVCIGQCHGSAFEQSKESFYPIECVCDLEKAKFTYLLIYLERLVRKTRFFEQEEFRNSRQKKERIERYLKILSKIRALEEYEPWVKMAETVMSNN